MIADRELFFDIKKYWKSILKDKFSGENYNEQVQCIILKTMQLVTEDLKNNFYEEDLERPLDFGHTFSSVIEVKSQFSILHGEAVAIDMAIAARISVLLGRFPEEQFLEFISLLKNIGLPIFSSQYCIMENMNIALEQALIHRAGSINLVIPETIGKITYLRKMEELPSSILKQALTDLAQLS
jgi:3-dehydroquinate synthase